MSVRHTEKLLDKLWKELESSPARKALSNKSHIVYLRHAALRNAYQDAYFRVQRKHPELPDLSNSTVFSNAAYASISRMRIYLKKKGVKSKETYQSIRKNSRSYLAYVTPKGGYGPIGFLKNVAVEYINKQLGEDQALSKESPKGEMSQQALFKTAIEFHHKGMTVGAAQLSQSLAFLERSSYFKDFAASSEIKSLRDVFGDFDLNFIVDPADLSKISIKENLSITGDIDSYLKNFAGSETNDWVNLKPGLEKSLRKWAEKQDWWNRKGSRSLSEDSVDAIEDIVVTKLTKASNVYAKKKTKTPSRKTSNARVTKKATNPKGRGGTKKARKSSKAQKGVSSAPLYLIGVMNEQLPRVLEKNMQPPRLQYQTGRFANSVRVTDITTTPQGFPSIGYTYDKFPYQTFEPGYAQGSVERDPRRLIDFSMREIALQYAIGRFYTRRQ